MTRHVLLLLGARLRLLYNAFRRGKFWAKVGWIMAVLALLGGAAFSGFSGFGLARLLDLLQDPEFQQALLEAGISLTLVRPVQLLQSLLSLIVLAIWGMILMSSLGAALNNFYLSSDLDLLVTAPIPMRAIFMAKFLEGLGLGYLLLFALGGPALIGLGVGAGYAWPYFLGAFLVLVVLPLVPESLGTLLVMPLVRVIPPKRLREVLQVLGGLIGVAFYFFSQLSQGREMDPQTAGRLIGWLYRLNLPFLPQGWVGHGLMALGDGRYGQGLLALVAFSALSLGLYTVCLVAAERLYYSGWASLQTAPPTPRPRRARRIQPAREIPFLSRSIQAILVKDLRLFLRDPKSWTGMLMPLAVYVLFLVQSLRSSPPEGGMSLTLLPLLGSGIVFFMCTSMVSRLGLGGIGSERKQIWLLQCAPVPPRRILWAKFLAAYLPFWGLGGVMLLVLIVVSGAEWLLFLGNWLLLGLIGLGVTGISVGLGASFPRLEGENPQQVVSPGAGCLYFPLIALYAGIVSGAVLLPPLLAGLLERLGIPALAWISWGGGALVAITLTAVAVWVPLKVGAARLAALEV